MERAAIRTFRGPGIEVTVAHPTANPSTRELGGVLDDEDGVATAVEVVNRIGRSSSRS